MAPLAGTGAHPVRALVQARPHGPGISDRRYLTQVRGLPEAVLAYAARLRLLREGPRAWFAHCDGGGHLTGIEMRGPTWSGFSANGAKTLFRLPGGDPSKEHTHFEVTEAVIDALGLAALEDGPFPTVVSPAAVSVFQAGVAQHRHRHGVIRHPP